MQNYIFSWDFFTLISTLVLITNIIFAIILVFFEKRNPVSTLVWLMVILFIPIWGFLLYLFLGQDLRKRKIFILKKLEEENLVQTIRRQHDLLQRHHYQFKNPQVQAYTDMIQLNLLSSDAPLTEDNHIKIYATGEDKFRAFIKSLEEAKEYIYLQYYIIKNDPLGKEVLEILTKKAREGIEVKVLYDGMGSRSLTKDFFTPLIEAGGKVAIFLPPFVPYINLRVNYRNHRKICVIDGENGFVGGFNIGEEYLGKSKIFGFWRDVHLHISGSAVNDLKFRFILDWRFASKEEIPFQESKFEKAAGDIAVQIVSSGPDSKWKSIRNGYLKIINSARNHIYIETPYFIPDDEILSALKIAALSGVDVRVITPKKPDHPFVRTASMSYMGGLLETGVRFFQYEKGFIHSKAITSDGFVSSVGTANLDIRSFRVNFEVNAFIYNQKIAEELEEIFITDMHDSQEMTLDMYNSRPRITRLKESISRLLSPLL